MGLINILILDTDTGGSFWRFCKEQALIRERYERMMEEAIGHQEAHVLVGRLCAEK